LKERITAFQQVPDESLYSAALKKLGSDPRVLLRANTVHLGDTSPNTYSRAMQILRWPGRSQLRYLQR
jgi:hypothetical protein